MPLFSCSECLPTEVPDPASITPYLLLWRNSLDSSPGTFSCAVFDSDDAAFDGDGAAFDGDGAARWHRRVVVRLMNFGIFQRLCSKTFLCFSLLFSA